MNEVEFIKGLEEQLETETTLELSTNIKELEEWDSLNAMVLISYVSEVTGLTLSGKDVTEITTVESLINKIGRANFQ